MAKLNYQKLSYNSRMASQPIVNAVPKTKKKKKVKKQTRNQAIDNETTFLSGQYQLFKIMTVWIKNPGYFEWVLEHQPKSITAKQIINFFNKHPDQLK
jgi:hypothetical protein